MWSEKIKEKVLEVMKPEVLISEREMLGAVTRLASSTDEAEPPKPSLDPSKFSESVCVYKTHPYNISLSSWLQRIPRLVFSVFVSASGGFITVIIHTSYQRCNWVGRIIYREQIECISEPKPPSGSSWPIWQLCKLRLWRFKGFALRYLHDWLFLRENRGILKSSSVFLCK